MTRKVKQMIPTSIIAVAAVFALVGMYFLMEANDRKRERPARKLAAMLDKREANKGK